MNDILTSSIAIDARKNPNMNDILTGNIAIDVHKNPNALSGCTSSTKQHIERIIDFQSPIESFKTKEILFLPESLQKNYPKIDKLARNMHCVYRQLATIYTDAFSQGNDIQTTALFDIDIPEHNRKYTNCMENIYILAQSQQVHENYPKIILREIHTNIINMYQSIIEISIRCLDHSDKKEISRYEQKKRKHQHCLSDILTSLHREENG